MSNKTEAELEVSKYNYCMCGIEDLQPMIAGLSSVLRKEVSVTETNFKGIYVLDCSSFMQTPITIYGDIEVVTHIENSNVYVDSIRFTSNYM